ncbi:MAG: hypothetical protein EBZ53_08530 [Verrucomicrobia bacterium]|nr:hypothetical protein [Verrucomicrobiota bacterium]
MIQIEGLSPKQHIIADALWECQTEGEVQQLFEVFPVKEVLLVKEMMIAATMDTIVNDDVDEAKQYLQRFQ